MRGWLRSCTAIDLRSLAGLRIALGLVVLADLVIRAPDLAAFAGEDGVVPRAERLRYYGVGTLVSVWDLVADHPSARAALFGGIALAGLALVLGYRTRLATVVCWIAVQGFMARNPPISTGGDLLMNALLLWGAFLPLGARWSLDALRRPPLAPPREVTGLAPAVLVLQLLAMMVLSGSCKLGDPTWRAGDGVYYALHAEFYATSLAHALRQASWLLGPLTYAVLAFELGGPLLALSPWRPAAARLVFALGLIALNLGFWLCLRVGIFSWAAMAGALVFVPGAAWDALARRGGARAAALEAALTRRRGPPRPWRFGLPRPAAGLLIVLAGLAVYGNLHPRAWVLPPIVHHASKNLGLMQRGWPMFAPTARDHGWFVIPGTLASGRVVDLHDAGAEVSYDEPPLRSADFPSYRWRKLYHNMRRSGALRRLYAAYLCRAWNARAVDPLVSLELVYMKQTALPEDQETPVKRTTLVRHTCDAEPGARPGSAESAPDDAQGE